MFDKLKSMFSRGSVETEDRAYTPSNQVELFLQNYSTKGLNESQILNAVGSNPVFFSCINLIANSVASVDYGVDDARITKILAQPNAHHSGHTFMWLISAYLSAVGRVYVWVRKDKSLVTVSPLDVVHTGGLGYQFRHGQEVIKAILYEDLICITAPDLMSPFSGGTGLGHVLSQEIDISEAAAAHELGYLKNHSRPDFIANFAGMSEDSLIQLKAGYDKAHKGGKSSGKGAFSNADKLDLKTLTSSFKDLGLESLRSYSADTIRQAFGIPKELLGAKDMAERSGIDGAEYTFAKYVVKPRVDLILSEFNAKLLPMLGSKGKIEALNIIPEDRKHRLEVAKAFPDALTTNEIRVLADLEPIKGGDTLGGAGPPVQYEEEPIRNVPLISCRTGVFSEERHFRGLFKELEGIK